MKAEDVRCKKCGGGGSLHGCDYCNDEGPWYIACVKCGEETNVWALARQAWKQWKFHNTALATGATK